MDTLEGTEGTENETKKALPTCIAPHCRKPSKGPRFKYLCEAHRGAAPDLVKIWQSKTKVNRKEGSKVARKAS